MSGETDIINEKKDYWLYIKDENENTGWIFGGYAIFDGRGGLKYHNPKDYVWYMLFGDEL